MIEFQAPISMKDFRTIVMNYYYESGRDLPWRRDYSPYSAMVSEIMLQQTQVSRVIPKYEQFIYSFPDFSALSKASIPDLLLVWKGLGYNRRALWLQRAADMVMEDFDGVLPTQVTELIKLPGIGLNTAGAILAYAYNQPIGFIETNIRRVFLYHFFYQQDNVHDRELMPFILQAVQDQEPRIWYWALMDYGSYLARQVPNPNRKSRHYARQSKFEGSHRQLRGRILEIALQQSFTLKQLGELLSDNELTTIKTAVAELTHEGFLSQNGETLTMKR